MDQVNTVMGSNSCHTSSPGITSCSAQSRRKIWTSNYAKSFLNRTWPVSISAIYSNSAQNTYYIFYDKVKFVQWSTFAMTSFSGVLSMVIVLFAGEPDSS